MSRTLSMILTCSTAEVPNFNGAIVTAGHNFGGIVKEFGGHHFPGMSGQRVLEAYKRSAVVRGAKRENAYVYSGAKQYETGDQSRRCC